MCEVNDAVVIILLSLISMLHHQALNVVTIYIITFYRQNIIEEKRVKTVL